MKHIKLLLLAFVLTFSSIQKSQAAVAGVGAIAGVAAAGEIALTGLGAAGIGSLMTIASCRNSAQVPCLIFGIGGLIIGGILLDGETGLMEFSALSEQRAQALKLSRTEMNIYNAELAEANLVFREVTSELNAESSVEESRALWNEYSQMLSPETFKVMKALATNAE